MGRRLHDRRCSSAGHRVSPVAAFTAVSPALPRRLIAFRDAASSPRAREIRYHADLADLLHRQLDVIYTSAYTRVAGVSRRPPTRPDACPAASATHVMAVWAGQRAWPSRTRSHSRSPSAVRSHSLVYEHGIGAIRAPDEQQPARLAEFVDDRPALTGVFASPHSVGARRAVAPHEPFVVCLRSGGMDTVIRPDVRRAVGHGLTARRPALGAR